MYNKLKQERESGFNSQQDELDLRYVFEKIGDAFHYLYARVRYVINVALKRAMLLFVFVLLGLALGYAAFKFTKPYYTSSMTLVLAEIRNQFVENQLGRLSVMIEENNFEAVAEDLKINIESARQIKEMNFYNLDQDRIAEDSVLTGSPFEIELSLYNNTLFPSVETALANYLESNKYFSKQKLIRQRAVESLIKKLQSDISALDSVKRAVASPRGPVNGFVYGEPIDPANLFRESIKMYEQQVELEGDLEQIDNIQIVNGFAPRLRPTGPSFLKYLAIGAGIAFITSIIVALMLENRKVKES